MYGATWKDVGVHKPNLPERAAIYRGGGLPRAHKRVRFPKGAQCRRHKGAKTQLIAAWSGWAGPKGSDDELRQTGQWGSSEIASMGTTVKDMTTIIVSIRDHRKCPLSTPAPPLHAPRTLGPVILSWCPGPVDNGTPRTERKRGVPELTGTSHWGPTPIGLAA